MGNVQYMRCPYCGTDGSHGKRVSKKTGVFRVKELYTNVLIFQCLKCRKVCRRQAIGPILQWEDMSSEEKKDELCKWHREFVNKTKCNGGKNGKEI